MPYYQGDYYRGDYYQGGIFDVIKKGLGAVASTVVPGYSAIRGAYNVGRSIVGRPAQPVAPAIPRMIRPPQQMIGGGGVIGGKPGKLSSAEKKMMGVKPRRMNVGNAKALRRAIRRQAGFVKLAKRALKGSGYKIVTKGSGGRRVSVREAGAGSVTVH